MEIHLQSVAQQHQLIGIGKPKHPLFSVLRFDDFPKIESENRVKLLSDCYQITLKKDCPCKLKYGQTHYDFDEGVMSFFSPKQVTILEPGDVLPPSGWLLVIHPDFLQTYPINQKIKAYGFFDYAVNEALILSEDEEASIDGIFRQLEKEYQLPIDTFSQDVLVANIDLLLTLCNRYYNRQFITRKPTNQTLLSKVDKLLTDYLEAHGGAEKGLPTATFIAAQLNLSPKYLSDLLRQLTGRSIQQHIHDKLIEKAKEQLATTTLSVSEIAYALGFDYPQSFNKLFKNKTNTSPLAYRQSFN
ncbi:helix-turn-helix domain-containing protein [Spirosoma litoris]